ncbi:prepilin-type N-terminal cleavage/methylation domain-containing protein [Parashewanella tropica]|uniref:prepilin-type N-terminal cleavage/methylation domain-containing protein n=1 Tax=Parashewanella tropica TaxID=2547970 RepID=UPI0010599C53|nr:prepilin-type N-terminal cleavage/methylation domain-containing protein [Parashewanella tropica]
MRHSGFTLIELVITIIIIGLISVIAIPKFISFSDEANLATAQYTFKQFEQSAKLFHSKCVASGWLGLAYRGGSGASNRFEAAIRAAGLHNRPSGSGSCYPESTIRDGNFSNGRDCAYTMRSLLNTDMTITRIESDNANSPETTIVAKAESNQHICTFYYQKGFKERTRSKMPLMIYNAAKGTFTYENFN